MKVSIVLVIWLNSWYKYELFIEVVLLAQNQVGYQITVAHMCECYVQLSYIPDYSGRKINVYTSKTTKNIFS